MSVHYAYLKPSQGDSPFYVHLTLDDKARSLRVYWHMAWWKNETVDDSIFDTWRRTFTAIASNMERVKTKERKNSYEVKGQCRISSMILRDVMGYIEPDTEPELSVKLLCYVNSQNKIIEIEFTTPYKPLGAIPVEWLRLKNVFTESPDYETVRPKLVFFNPSRIILRHQTEQKLEKLALSDKHLPRHHGSPEASKRTVLGHTQAHETTAVGCTTIPELVLEGGAGDERRTTEFSVDTTLNTWDDGHPYGLPLVAEHSTTAEPTLPTTESNHGSADPTSTTAAGTSRPSNPT